MNKKRMLTFLLVLAMAVSVFAGCSKDSSDKSSKDAGGKKEKDTLVILDTQVVEAFDPLNTALNYKLEWHQLFDVLIEFQEDGSLGPALAESFEPTDDGKGYIFHLRDDVDFIDGTHFDAEAVKYCVDKIRSFELSAWVAAYIGEAEVIDEYTVRINKAASHTKLLEFLAEYLYIVSPTAYEKDPEGFAKNPVGSGSYKFKEIGADGYIYMEANEDYFRGEPYFKNLVFRTPLDPSTAVVALQNGELDMVLTMPQDQVELVKDDPKFNVISSSGWGVKSVFLEGPNLMNDQNLRKAIFHAVNRENAIEFDNAPKGAEPATNMYSERMMGDFADFMDIGGYDIELAKEYLAKSNYDGKPLKLTITTDLANIAQSVQEDLKAIGVQTEINQLDANAFWAAFADGSCDITIASWGCDYASLEEQMGFHAGTGYYGEILYNTPEFDQLLADAANEWDEEKRAALCEEALKMTHDFANMVPIYEDTMTNVYNAELDGIQDIWSATYNLYLYQVKLK
ncbi:MAG: ABC transporter substrate-binding protein [Dorea sp.]|nr:ABC transporter substrate-binding protein [Dorea sp.]